MKHQRTYMDLGEVFDELFDAAKDFSVRFGHGFDGFPRAGWERGQGGLWGRDETTDYYPGYSYPPMNVYFRADRSLAFEFALAGFEEDDLELSFQGDYMIFSARYRGASAQAVVGEDGCPSEMLEEDGGRRPADVHYLKRRLKFKDIERQKYYVPQDKYAQEDVRAVFRNGVLRVTVPAREERDSGGGVRIEIVKEGN